MDGELTLNKGLSLFSNIGRWCCCHQASNKTAVARPCGSADINEGTVDEGTPSLTVGLALRRTIKQRLRMASFRSRC
jgi:hypothetical protein